MTDTSCLSIDRHDVSVSAGDSANKRDGGVRNADTDKRSSDNVRRVMDAGDHAARSDKQSRREKAVR